MNRVPFALVAAMLSGAIAPLHAQASSPFALVGGPSFAFASSYASRDFGLHVGMDATHWSSSRWGFRFEAAAHLLPAAASEPSCIPGGSCVGRTIMPSQLYGAALGVTNHPYASRRLELALGGGVYLGDGIGDSPWSFAPGISANLRLTLRDDGHGPGVELHYQHFTRGIGEMRGLVAPAISWSF